MRRVALLAIVAVLLLAGIALAEGGPVNPDRMAAKLPAVIPEEAQGERQAAAGDKAVPGEPPQAGKACITVELVSRSGEFYAEDTVWQVKADGGKGRYEYRYYVVCVTDTLENADPHGFRDWSRDDVYRYRFVVPGNYALFVYVRDRAGNTGNAAFRLAVPDDGRPTTAQRVEEIVSACRAAGCSGDFETALWLHDWIAAHACYDFTHSYYSADGVLIRGTGVCDSYSKAYRMLLERAGIDCGIVENSNHAWNIARLDGDWYQIDPTWDDPGETGPVSGEENHLYFALPDEIMTQDHRYEPQTPCVAYADNYFIRTGKVSLWTDPLRPRILRGLDGGVYRFSLDLPASYPTETGEASDKPQIAYGLAAWALGGTTEWQWNGLSLRLDPVFSRSDMSLSVAVDFCGEVLDLPPGLKVVRANAFAGCAARAAVLPEGCERIGARAFADCANLWKITLPASVVFIDESAFANDSHLTIACPAGSYAEAFARAHGFSCEAE